MLFGAAIGYWATQRVRRSDAAVLLSPSSPRAWRRGGDGRDPCVPHDHDAREPDRVGARADDLRRRPRPVRYFGNEAPPRRLAAGAPVRRDRRLRAEGPAGVRPDPVRPVRARLPLLGADPRVAFYLARTRLGAQRARCWRGARLGRRHGHQRQRSTATSTCSPGAPRRRRGLCYSLSITPGWIAGDTLVNGAGWIAIALVIFAFWRAELCLVGAYLFGGLAALPFALQAHERDVTPEFLHALPYVMTIVVLVIVSTGFAKQAARRAGALSACRTCAKSGRTRTWTFCTPRSFDEALG